MSGLRHCGANAYSVSTLTDAAIRRERRHFAFRTYASAATQQPMRCRPRGGGLGSAARDFFIPAAHADENPSAATALGAQEEEEDPAYKFLQRQRLTLLYGGHPMIVNVDAVENKQSRPPTNNYHEQEEEEGRYHRPRAENRTVTTKTHDVEDNGKTKEEEEFDRVALMPLPMMLAHTLNRLRRGSETADDFEETPEPTNTIKKKDAENQQQQYQTTRQPQRQSGMRSSTDVHGKKHNAGGDAQQALPSKVSFGEAGHSDADAFAACGNVRTVEQLQIAYENMATRGENCFGRRRFC